MQCKHAIKRMPAKYVLLATDRILSVRLLWHVLLLPQVALRLTANHDKPGHGMEKALRAHCLFQECDPLLGFFRCDDLMLLSKPHSLNEVRERSDKFIVRCHACQRLYLDIGDARLLEQPIEAMADIRLTHAAIAKAEKTARHVRIGSIKHLRLVIAVGYANLAARFCHADQLCKGDLRLRQVEKNSIGIATIKDAIRKGKVMDIRLHKA